MLDATFGHDDKSPSHLTSGQPNMTKASIVLGRNVYVKPHSADVAGVEHSFALL